MRHLGLLLMIGVTALTWPSAASADHLTLPAAAVESCEAAIDSQIGRGIQPGGGPKGGDVAPINCDSFWFRGDVIGNELAGGPVACFWSLHHDPPLPEHCPPGS